MRKLNLFLVFLFSALVFLSVFMIYKQISLQHKESEKFDKLIEIVENTNDDIQNTSDTLKETESSEKVKRAGNLKALFEKNADCIGWICIDGTNINYPVMYTPNDPQKYLRRDFDGEYSIYGVPFLDYRCNMNTANLIIYGHNMKNGTMFADLKEYLVSDFLSAHKIIEFETADGVRYFTVTDIVKTNTADKRYTEICSSDGRCLILSTCYGKDKNGRLLVVAEEL